MIRDLDKCLPSEEDYFSQELLEKIKRIKDTIRKEQQWPNSISKDDVKKGIKSIDEVFGFMMPNNQENNDNKDVVNRDVKFEKMSSDAGYAPSVYFGSADTNADDSFCIIASGAIEKIQEVVVSDRKISIRFVLSDIANQHDDLYLERNNIFVVNSIGYSFDIKIPYGFEKSRVFVYYHGNKITVIAPRLIDLPSGSRTFSPKIT